MDLAEGVQILWLRRTEKPVPGIGAEGHDAGQPAFEVPEAHRAQKRRQIAAQRLYRGFVLLAGIDCHDEKNRRPVSCATTGCDAGDGTPGSLLTR